MLSRKVDVLYINFGLNAFCKLEHKGGRIVAHVFIEQHNRNLIEIAFQNVNLLQIGEVSLFEMAAIIFNINEIGDGTPKSVLYEASVLRCGIGVVLSENNDGNGLRETCGKRFHLMFQLLVKFPRD